MPIFSSPQVGPVFRRTGANHINLRNRMQLHNLLGTHPPFPEPPGFTQIIYIHDANLAVPCSKTKTCQTHLSGRSEWREISLFTKPLLMVRMHSTGYRLAEIDTNFAVMPRGTKIISAESCGISAWTKTAKVSVVLPDGSPKRYFLKVNVFSSCCINACC